jgi:DNA (cytosine-5)-methyltransferase 1
MNSIKNKLEAVDFFCGAGGVTCGFRQAGIDVLGGIDIDANCKATYETNNDSKFLNVDVSNFDKKELKNAFKIKQNQDNLIFVGCSPCQYYSNIKTDKTKSTKTRYLLADFQEYVDYYKPGYVFVENVPGLDKKKDSPLTNFKKFLKSNGYNFDDGILNAKYFGVPQNRRRYILVASRVNQIKMPKSNKEELYTVKDAIGNLNVFKKIKAGHKDKSSFFHTTANLSKINIERIKSTPKNGGDRSSWENNDKLQLNCYKTHNGHYDVYGRMHWDKPSPAITTRFLSLSNGRYGHPEQNRAISLREGATLQSFPINYKFPVNSMSSASKMIGNAVPPEFAKRIAAEIISQHQTHA